MFELCLAAALECIFAITVLVAIPRVAERFDDRQDGRTGLRIVVAGIVPYCVEDHDWEGLV